MVRQDPHPSPEDPGSPTSSAHENHISGILEGRWTPVKRSMEGWMELQKNKRRIDWTSALTDADLERVALRAETRGHEGIR